MDKRADLRELLENTNRQLPEVVRVLACYGAKPQSDDYNPVVFQSALRDFDSAALTMADSPIKLAPALRSAVVFPEHWVCNLTLAWERHSRMQDPWLRMSLTTSILGHGCFV